MAHGRKDNVNYEEDLDQIDFANYKGMFYQDDPGQKYQDEVTGSHFEYNDMCRRLKRLQKEMQYITQTTGTSASDELSNGIDGVDEACVNVHRATNDAAQVVQASRAHGQLKESRNAVQALPQQGYGTVGAYCREAFKANVAEPKNFRQFSSQLEPPPQKPHIVDRQSLNQGSNRSKSIDKPHAVPSKPNNGSMIHAGAMVLKGGSNKLPVNTQKNKKEQETNKVDALCDL